MKPKKSGIVIVAVGAVLILSALLLLLYNRREDARAGREAESRLVNVEAIIAAKASEDPVSNVAQTQPVTPPTPLAPELPVVKLEGYEYVGYIEIPELELKLPVMSEWDYDRLKLAPCRQFGSSRTDDLVIAAHNYDKHFSRLKALLPGDDVTFTDMEGIVNTYAIERVETLNPTEVEAVQNSGYDLVLYTCTYGGRTRVVVFCNRTLP